ncbi:MAG: hypothetical protein Q8920_03175 [Bacillota bacterium]|nr:hypothetical protein [Bacillota bacterium]
MEAAGRKVLTGRSCYGHLGGKLGERLFVGLLELGWLVQAEGRTTVYEITEKGHKEFEKLGIKLD